MDGARDAMTFLAIAHACYFSTAEMPDYAISVTRNNILIWVNPAQMRGEVFVHATSFKAANSGFWGMMT
jgi:hypothetical protein